MNCVFPIDGAAFSLTSSSVLEISDSEIGLL